MSDQSTDDIQRVPSQSPDFQTKLAQKLNELVPEVIADGKVDVKKLQELLDGDTTDDSERFGLFWPGKKRAMRAAQEPTTATLKPAKDESKDWNTTENIFIEGDNLETLKILQKYYHNKIKMIYIDPPYNTGKDFVYPDNFKEGLQNYLEFSKQVDEGGKKTSTNSDTDGRYHSNWLNMMYPRIKLARNLLTDDGVIFISIDDNEQDNLRKLCNEILGEENFITQFIWEKRVTRENRRNVSVRHDYVLAYARNSRTLESAIKNTPMDEAALARYSNPDDDQRGVWTSAPATAQAGHATKSQFYSFDTPGGRMVSPPAGRCWLYTESRMSEEISKNNIWFGKDGNGVPRIKKFLIDEQGLTPETIWWARDAGTNDSAKRALIKLFDNIAVFDTPKPVQLMKVMLRIGSDRSSTILDFFSGTGTLAEAVMEINSEDGGSRNHIQVQLPEPTNVNSEPHKAGYKTISDISKERIRRAGEKIKTDYADKISERESPLDVGFKVFKLADSNFTKWQNASDTDKDSLQQHLLDIRESSNDAATEEELMTEVLLKQGISLTAKIKHEVISGLSVWDVRDKIVLAYLNESIKPTLDQLREIVATEPAKIIMLEDAFKGDDELKTNLTQICKTNKIELWTV